MFEPCWLKQDTALTRLRMLRMTVSRFGSTYPTRCDQCVWTVWFLPWREPVEGKNQEFLRERVWVLVRTGSLHGFLVFLYRQEPEERHQTKNHWQSEIPTQALLCHRSVKRQNMGFIKNTKNIRRRNNNWQKFNHLHLLVQRVHLRERNRRSCWSLS